MSKAEVAPDFSGCVIGRMKSNRKADADPSIHEGLVDQMEDFDLPDRYCLIYDVADCDTSCIVEDRGEGAGVIPISTYGDCVAESFRLDRFFDEP